jgi:hypothetical protein
MRVHEIKDKFLSKLLALRERTLGSERSNVGSFVAARQRVLDGLYKIEQRGMRPVREAACLQS